MAASTLPEKPTPLAPIFDNIPLELREKRQWVLWRYVWKEDAQKWTKPPFQPNGSHASTTDPTTWRTFDAVKKTYRTKQFDGIGFVFNGDYTGIDMDKHIDADLVAKVASYTELSPSGTGAHIITRGPVSADEKGGRRHGDIEMYYHGRFFAVTGHTLAEIPTPITTTNGAVHERYGLLSTPTVHASTSLVTTTYTAIPQAEQEQRFALAMQLVQMHLRHDKAFAKLWRGEANYRSNSDALYGLLRDLEKITILDETLTKLLVKHSPVYLRNPEKYDRTIDKYDSASARNDLLATLPLEHIEYGLPILTEEQANALPLPEWVLPGILVKGQITVLSGKKGSFKTFEAIHQTMKVAQQMNTLYIAAEDPIGVGIRRQAWRKHYQCDTGVMLTIPQAVRFHDPQEVKALIDVCAAYSIAHITIDTMAACTRGLNENAADDMGKVLEGLEYVREQTCASMLVLAHESSKNANGIRGWSGIGDASYVELSAQRVEKSHTVTLKSVRVKMAQEVDFTHTLVEVDNTLVVTELAPVFIYPQRERIRLAPQMVRLLRVIGAKTAGATRKDIGAMFDDPKAKSITVDLSRLKNDLNFIAQAQKGAAYTLTTHGMTWLQEVTDADDVSE